MVVCVGGLRAWLVEGGTWDLFFLLNKRYECVSTYLRYYRSVNNKVFGR